MKVGTVGLMGRLLLGHGLVVAAGGVTGMLVAAVAGPPIFREHLSHVTGVPPATSSHVEQAYVSAGILSLGLALMSALVVAVAASVFAARRLTRPVAALAAGAAHVASGHYSVRVSSPGIGVEFDRVTTAFNQMSSQLEAVEASRRRLLADLAHEMRTPLATIEAYLDAAADGIEVTGEDATQVLRAQSARLRRLSDDLRAIAHAEELTLQRRPAEPAALVAAAVGAARARYVAKGVTLRERCDPGLPRVSVDPDRMQQVLANLLDNALRHTQPGGEVNVTAHATGGAVVLQVSDSGEGILPTGYRTCSNASTAPVPHAVGSTAASGSGWRSYGRWSRPTVAGSGRTAPVRAVVPPSRSRWAVSDWAVTRRCQRRLSGG